MRINPTEIAKTLINQICAVVCTLGFSTFLSAQDWQPEILSDGQPNITGMWNNVGATATPLEMPAEFDGKVPTADEVADLISRRDEARKGNVWDGFENSQGVGAYENYWFDWYWSDAVADAPALIVDPPNGQLPAYTAEAQEAIRLISL